MQFLKSFESMFKVEPTELVQEWDYYFCNDCESEFSICNPKFSVCKYCSSKDLVFLKRKIKLV
jgi:DNA-directed RNA polymerase subunit RPC12/RpoP